MTEDKNINKTTPQSEEQEIDLIELAQKVWAGRKLVLKVCGVAVLVGLVVAFSIPKEYSTSVTLAVLILAVQPEKMHFLPNCILILLVPHLFYWKCSM